MLGHYPGSQEVLSNKRGHDTLGYPVDGSQKRAKTLTPPSKVVHIRNLPQECMEAELLAIATAFGKVTNMLLLRGANQAFIQMSDQPTATALVEYYSTNPCYIRANVVYLQYSNREEITAPPTSHEPANSILLSTISNMSYPITIDVLQTVFSRYGNVHKIVIFSSKTGAFQCLVQMADIPSAVNAKSGLDGQNIYVGCCALKIQYSNLTSLEVKFNNEKSRDFTNPTLPSAAAGGGGAAMNAMPQMGASVNMPPMGGMGTMGGYGMGPMGMGMDTMGYANMYAPGMMHGMPGMPGMPGQGPMPGSVVIVSGLDPRVTPDVLFTLFGVYGDVHVVKVLYNKKDTALVQMASPQQAEFVIAHLNGVALYNGTLHINVSKHASIHVNKNSTDPDSNQFTKDFSNSPLHRFKKPGSKNFMHITPPSPTLHISNIPPTSNEASLRSLFSQWGQVVAFKYFSNDTKMALIQMEGTREAVEALVGAHNLRIDENLPNHLRVSFAKTQIRDNTKM